ncbi:MAG: FAD-binding oxidoreductase [Chloroflexaceae bacterium]|nr:FAD-binding oxidoreductase [Chloroflexaceae bacterium]
MAAVGGAAAKHHKHLLALSVPRTALANTITRAQTIAARYHLTLQCWGDLGSGRLWLALQSAPGYAIHDAEIEQAATLIAAENLATSRPPARAQPPVPGRQGFDLLHQCAAIVGPDYVLTRRGDLLCYSQDASIAHADGLPQAVVLPATTAEVSAVLRLAHAAGVPVVTRGAGSGLAGGAVPPRGRWCWRSIGSIPS